MAISVTCASCRYSSRVPEEHAGKDVICPQCGNNLRVPKADAAPDAPPPPDSIVCPHCGRSVTAKSKTCLWCGMPVDRPMTEVTEVVRRSDAGMPEPTATGTKICPYCAEEIRAAALKCPLCNEILDEKLAAERRQSSPTQQAGTVIVMDLERKARDSLIIGLFGLFVVCLGFILGPVAIIQGINVNKEYSKLGRPANGMATAAIVLGCLAIVGFVVFVFLQSA
jgi:predicted RNA-binding Zn-ribbon protein involved in translation (DUF1610 family)